MAKKPFYYRLLCCDYSAFSLYLPPNLQSLSILSSHFITKLTLLTLYHIAYFPISFNIYPPYRTLGTFNVSSFSSLRVSWDEIRIKDVGCSCQSPTGACQFTPANRFHGSALFLAPGVVGPASAASLPRCSQISLTAYSTSWSRVRSPLRE